ncbi:hypothetical protein A5743_14310 [Mycolicibacterium conceptionense]|nr:hypothetical protein A5743_14310 [Mycolicibacterium conceptionense]
MLGPIRPRLTDRLGGTVNRYDVIINVMNEHRWSHTAVLQGEYCRCGFNGDHDDHLVLCIMRALDDLT